MDEKFNEFRDVLKHPGLQVRGDGMAVRSVKSSSGSAQKVQYYPYTIKQTSFGRSYIKRRPKGEEEILYVDELVASCFCPLKSGCPRVAHKDFDITNNHYDNLEWVNENDFVSKYHYNRIKDEFGERFALWKNNWYISEIGHLLIDGWLYDEKDTYTNVDDYDVGFRRATHAFVPYDDDVFIRIEEGVKAVWNKVILHVDGNYGNWQESNLKAVDSNDPKAQNYDAMWMAWKKEEDKRLFWERYPNCPLPSFLN